MLRRQYGAYRPNAQSSSSTGVHAEDAQPNETIDKRAQKLPPMIRTTQPDLFAFNQRGRGGYRGLGRGRGGSGNSHGSWEQRGGYAFRGESRGRGRGFYPRPSQPEHEPLRDNPTSSWSAGSTAQVQTSSFSRMDRSNETPRRDYTSLPKPMNRTSSPAHSQSPYTVISEETASRMNALGDSTKTLTLHSRSPSPDPLPTSVKRRKLNHGENKMGTLSTPSISSPVKVWTSPMKSVSPPPPISAFQETSGSTDTYVKLEPRSPSPSAILPQRKLVTESCSFYPYPVECKSTVPQYKENRRAFFLQKNKELKRLGLQRTKVLSRDDGLVIEWTSSVPVWSDTLLPEEPKPIPRRELVISSQSVYPYPESCLGSDPEARARRKAFHVEKNKELVALGLKRTRAYSKDGNLVMEWKTPVPVWSDTLLPEVQDLASSLQRAHSINYELTPSSQKTRERSPSVVSISSSLASPPRAAGPQPLQSQADSQHPPLKKKKKGRRERQRLKELKEQAAALRVLNPQDDDIIEIPPLSQSQQRKTTPIEIASSPRKLLPLPRRPDRVQPVQEVLSVSEPRLNPLIPQNESTALPDLDTTTPTDRGFSEETINHMHFMLKSSNSVDKHYAEAPLAPPAPDSSNAVDEQHKEASPTPSAPAPQVKRMVFKPNRNLPRTSLSSATVPDNSADVGSAGAGSSPHVLVDEGQVEPMSTESSMEHVGQAAHEDFASFLRTDEGHISAIDVESAQKDAEHAIPPLTASFPPFANDGSASLPAPSIHPMEDSALDSKPANTNIAMTATLHISSQTNNASQDDQMSGANSADGLHNSSRGSSLEIERDQEMHIISDEETDLTEGNDLAILASRFLQRYCHLFDTDRSKLQMAYDKNASFSCRVHRLQQRQSASSVLAPGVSVSEDQSIFRSSLPQRSPATTTTTQDRASIVAELLSWGPYLFCPRGVTSSLNYDVVEFESGILLTTHGEIVNPNRPGLDTDHVVTLDQSFVLRERKEEDDLPLEAASNSEDSENCADWPLIAVAHQMTLRERRYLPS
ncbi:hypothetical protein CPC08DRAFT_704984 [Agrocybe pediades]|nr:hypothetical protein CPC08DRAFT_704984 [Agrocybe pediades]